MKKGNKGEWSEVYTLLKIISDRHLVAGDSNLNKIENIIFPILSVIRDQSNGTYEYAYEGDLVLIKGNDEEFRIPVSQFTEKAILLLKKLKSTTSTFSIPEIETFINSFNCFSLKAKSSAKSDIRIVIHDFRTGTNPELGFSIKSQLGGASTLFNAGKTTNFIYKIEGCKLSDEDINSLNSLMVKKGSKQHIDVKRRIKEIYEKGAKLTFVRNENSVFENNLTLIDSALPKILAEIVFKFFNSSFSKTVDLVNEISISNPLNFNLETNHPFYFYKIKRFLSDIALGMLASKVWTGVLDATGGYLVVRNDGEVVCYHIYNRNEFDDYLLNNTKLETASTTRHDFGYIYKEGDELFFKLNLQIRFLK